MPIPKSAARQYVERNERMLFSNESMGGCGYPELMRLPLGVFVLCELDGSSWGLLGVRAAMLKAQLAAIGAVTCYSIPAIAGSLPGANAPARELVAAFFLFSFQAGLNSAPSRSMACMITASLRARATRACRMVDRLAMANAQSFGFRDAL